MPITIGSNIASLVAQRRLASSSSKLSQLFERLGSGQRINRASDDAAGLAISESLNVKSRVFQRAKLNVNDGVSVLNTADGALGQMSSLLERMAQLAEQAANGSLTFSQRKSLQQEYAALDQEIRRITESTTFNGMHLLKGDYSQASHSQLVQGVDALVIGATPSYVDVSENGRFVVYTAPFSDANTKVVFDTQTGEQRSIDMGAARTLLGVSNTGDFYLANGTSSIERYSYSDNNVSTIFTAADSGAFMTDSFSVSADGSTIAFATDTHYENGASQDSGSRVVGNYKVSVYNIENDQVSQVDHSLGAFGIKTDLSGDGRHLAWSYLLGSMERGDVNGTSIDNVETLTTNSVTFFQINNSGAITFSSNEDIGGLNPGLQSNIFTIDSSGNASKLTDFQGVTFDQISISSDGTMVSFITNEDPWGLNTTGGFQAYRMDLTLGTYEQITQLSDNTFGSPTTEAVAISANGSTVIT
ncbi:MAG: hypothetical protein KDD55_09190, partial [Bdellovibrionales bacterium]|nr:hypothetical protein [Bdellovibrionales bacterium]